MTRLIDADALIDELGISDEDIVFKEILEDAPTVDAVPVVRCKDCKYWEKWNNQNGSCERLDKLNIIEGEWFGADADDFCSFGERKNDE